MKYNKETIISFVENYFYNNYKEFGDWINIKSDSSDKVWSLGINTKTNIINDFKGNWKGTFEKFVSEYLNISINETRKILAFNFKKKKKEKKKEKLETKIILPKYLTFDRKLYNEGKMALKYLLNRGITKHIILKNRIGFCIDGKYKGYIIFPYIENNEIVYFTARSYKNHKIKHLKPKGSSKQFVYNYDNINETLFITEGIMDALTLEQQIATCINTAVISNEQIEKILKKPNLKNIIFIPDNDERGFEEFIKNMEKIKSFIQRKKKCINLMFFLIKKGKDLNEAKIKHIPLNDCMIYNQKNIFKFNLYRSVL